VPVILVVIEMNVPLMSFIKSISFIPGFLNRIFLIVIDFAILILFSLISGHIVNALLSPVYVWVSEKTESIVTGKTFDFHLFQFLKDIIRGVIISIRNLVFSMFWSLIVWLITFFFPPLSIAVSMFIHAYFNGFTFIDYSCERLKMGYTETVNYVKKNKSLTTGIGFIFTLIQSIPFIGIFLSGIVGIISTVGAALAFSELQRQPS
jgi:CysZ protein